MKKLSLKKLNLEANDLIKRNQLKEVFGGYEGGYEGGLWTAKVTCNSGSIKTTSSCRTMAWIDSELPHLCTSSGIANVLYVGCV